jgi:gluconokinase
VVEADLSDGLRLVVMGVSGCGKSTLAQDLAGRLGLTMVDGDDLHGPASVAKMAAGVPLDDADRWPWLDRVGAFLAGATTATATPTAGTAGRVVACSALKRAYRDRIRARAPGVRFVFLTGSADMIRARLAGRTGHYMPSGLLESQLSTLETPGQDESDVIAVSIDQPVSALSDYIVSCINESKLFLQTT